MGGETWRHRKVLGRVEKPENPRRARFARAGEPAQDAQERARNRAPARSRRPA